MPPSSRHALITGGSRGIGLAIARLFAQKDIRCTLVSRSEGPLRAALQSLVPLQNSGSSNTKISSHATIAGDVSSSEFWSTSTTSSPLSKLLPRPQLSDPTTLTSRIDILVNCAGISQARLFASLDPDAIQNLISTNLTAAMLGTRFLMRFGYLKHPSKTPPKSETAGPFEGAETPPRPGPVVINVSSLLGLKGGYGAVAYAASKAGVLGFTRALASEYAVHRVRVNALVPGYVGTDMTTDLDQASLSERIPLGRFGTPEEIAHAALFLVENEYAHNCVLNLDGGLSAV